MYFYFLNVWTHESILVEYILKFTKKLKQFGKHLIKEKDFWYKKTTCPHAFLKCFQHIKGLLKHGEFSIKFYSCNFESIIYIYIMFPWWFFKNKKTIFKDCPYTIWFFFFAFTFVYYACWRLPYGKEDQTLFIDIWWVEQSSSQFQEQWFFLRVFKRTIKLPRIRYNGWTLLHGCGQHWLDYLLQV